MSEDFFRFIINATITLKEKKKGKKEKKNAQELTFSRSQPNSRVSSEYTYFSS